MGDDHQETDVSYCYLPLVSSLALAIYRVLQVSSPVSCVCIIYNCILLVRNWFVGRLQGIPRQC